MKQTSKDKVLAALEAHRGDFVSGGALAEELGISRNSVWKAVRALEAAGHSIESVTGKGYRLREDSNVLSAAAIRAHLHTPGVAVEYHEVIDSTNIRAKELGETGAVHGTLVVAEMQTAGRGRQGRQFVSPVGTGVYFTLLMRPKFSLGDIALITSYASVCVADAIEEVFGVHAQIKWVNDVFVGTGKVCGILTEASFDAESGTVSHVVVGIGINICAPEGSFGGIVGDGDVPADARARLIASVVDNFMRDFERIPSRPHLASYRERSILDGRDVEVFQGNESFMAHVEGVNDDLTLRARLADGTVRNLSHGEVHIPSSQLAQNHEGRLR